MATPDIQELMARVERVVAERRAGGAYDDPAVARAERSRLASLAAGSDQIGELVAQLHALSAVDYRGPGGVRPRGSGGRAARLVKSVVWWLLAFYHERLFGQQNAVNRLLVTGLDDYNRWLDARTERLAARLESVETGGRAPGAARETERRAR